MSSGSERNGISEVVPTLARDRRFWMIVALSAVVTVFNVAYLVANPPLDGDSYEYAGIARNFLETGRLEASHISGHFLTGQSIPHPAWDRATLWTFVLMPFHFLFGASFWTFSAPYLGALFFIGPMTYAAARGPFGRTVGLCAAVATSLHPRLIWWSTAEDPGQPDMLGALLFLAAMHLFMQRRWKASGLLTGLTILTRLHALMVPPVFGLWLLWKDRKEFRLRSYGHYLLMAALVAAPMFIRTAIVFGDPFYTDQAAARRGQGEGALEIARHYSALEIMFRDESTSTRTPPPGDWADALSTRVQFAAANARLVLFGAHSGVSFYPGVFELWTLTLTPLALFGLWRARRDAQRALPALFALANVAAVIVFKVGYEDRYLFMTVPCMAMLAFAGAQELSARLRWLDARRLLLVFVLIETAPQIAPKLVFGFQRTAPRQQYKELGAICDWVQRSTPASARLMTTPFWSPQYFCERSTVPPVLGPLESFRNVVDRYRVDYLLFTQYWGGDRFPRLPFLKPILRGGSLTLYGIDRGVLDAMDLSASGPPMAQFEPFGYFWQGRFPFRVDHSLWSAFDKILDNRAWAVAALAAVAAAALGSTLIRIPVLRWGAYGAIALLGTGVKMGALSDIDRFVNLTPPPVSRYQVQKWLGTGDGRAVTAVDIAEGGYTAGLKDVFASEHLEARVVESIALAVAQSPQTAVFVPVRSPERWIADRLNADRNAAAVAIEAEAYTRADVDLRSLGYRTIPIEGGVLGTPRPR